MRPHEIKRRSVAEPRRHLCQTAKTKIDGLGIVSWARTQIADTAEERLNRR